MHRGVRETLVSTQCAVLLCLSAAQGQLPTGHREVSKPGIEGVRIHTGALAPSLRKWYLPQNLYYEYRWRGWEYSNYAKDPYQRYVGILLNGTRQYDPLGNYISKGWRIYDWTENNPQAFGSSIFKAPQYGSWFSSLIVSSAHKGQFHTAVTIGDGIRTTLTPLTFSKPAFNGMQWDFLTDSYGLTLIASRVSSPGIPVQAITQPATTAVNSTRAVGGRGFAQLGDFAQVGATWVSAHHADNELGLGKNSLKGILTRPQNLGNVEQVLIRISDDSPESPESGAVLFLERIRIDGELQQITPLVTGGVREEGVLKARGTDPILLTYDIRNDFIATDETESFRDIRKIEFELIVANDYRVEVSSNKQLNRLGGEVFLPVFQARDNITDGSNQRFLRFEYGLPTANEVAGIDFELTNIHSVELKAEYVVNSRHRRFPNQNFRKLPPSTDRAEASYVTASWTGYPWFAYGEAFSIDADYTTSAFAANARGDIDYGNELRHVFEFVEDNDDQDRFPDWLRQGQTGQIIFFGELGAITGQDFEIFPGLDENNDFVSDFNQNRNSKPDYAEPFLRYAVDAPEFLFGMDMNNNTIIDRFEDDVLPDYPYERDRRGYNAYGGVALQENIHLTAGQLNQRQPSSGRKNRSTYGLLAARWNFPGLRVSFFEHPKRVRDNIAEDRIRWIDPQGLVSFRDPLENQDTFVNSLYFDAEYFRIPKLNLATKLKWEIFRQQGEEADLKRDRNFFGWIHKADYQLGLGESWTFWPKWKSIFRREVPTDKSLRSQREIEETFFLITRYAFLPDTFLDLGFEYSIFENLKKSPEVAQAGFIDDNRSLILAALFSNSSAYLGYKLTLNVGLQWQRQKFKEATLKETTALVRVFAATGEL